MFVLYSVQATFESLGIRSSKPRAKGSSPSAPESLKTQY